MTVRARPALIIALAAAGAGLSCLALGLLRWRYAVVTVSGPSMEPELHDGDQLLVRRCGVNALHQDQLVIFSEPGVAGPGRPMWLTKADQRQWVIKRVAAMPGDQVPDSVREAAGGAPLVPPRAIVVLGSAPGSRDSREWGFITADRIFGVGVRPVRPRAAACGDHAPAVGAARR